MPLGRILCVTSNFPRWPGDSTTPFVLHLAEDLQARGWQVDVLAPHAPSSAYTETMNGVRVERFQYLWPANIQTVCYQGGALINLRKNPLNKLKLPALIAAESVATATRLMRRDYDLLHSHWILPQGFTGMLARRLRQLPHVLTVHGGDVFGLRGPLMAPFKRAALRDADAVTVNSSVTEAAVRDTSDRIRRIERVPMGVSTRPLDSRQQALAVDLRQRHRTGHGPLLLFVGRLVEEKGVDDLLRATRQLRTRLPGLRSLIVGEGQDRPALEQTAQELGIADITTFTGWVNPSDVPAYLQAADIFVGPSRTAANGWVEAQGLTFLEAMVAQTPVIATRIGGIIDVVRHEQTGLLIDERSPEQLASAIERLADDAGLRTRMTEAALALARQRFSRDASANAFSTLFDDLVDQRRG